MSKMENNDVLINAMSPEEIEKNQVELMRYRTNALSYNLSLLGILLSVIAAFVGLNSIQYNMFTIVKILMNIAILLFGFLFAEKAKAYDKKASIYLIVLGAICFLRIFWAPLMLLNGTDSNLLSFVNNTGSNVNWLPASSTFRGILAMVLLICAGTSLCTAGVVGLKKSIKLSTYLNSLKESN